MATTPPDKHGQLFGWWTTAQLRGYLDGQQASAGFTPVQTSDLWSAEHRVGVQIDPGSFASAEGQLYAGSYLRTDKQTRFVAWAGIADPVNARNGEAAAREREHEQLAKLDWLLHGGEFRLARLWHKTEDGEVIADPLGDLRTPPEPPPCDGPCLLKWVLVTPAIFAQGSLPGWCVDTKKDRSDGPRPVGRICLELPGRAQLVSWCLGKPRTVSGWDVVEGRAKPTMLAVPEGGVYYFLCENPAVAVALARRLHWQPRSDFYGEKGCGYGLVSFDARMHHSSASVDELGRELFPSVT
jgi:CRISPR type III-B/RAMP module-associated protein Cmr3